jgi:cellulose synthase/poly-beta-1,6-N-acetylglucosamine synthase-like glycosyltransferase
VLCPLYKESAVLPYFVSAISKLDYDFSKLQVLLLLEEDDEETISAARTMGLPDHFEIVVVPHSQPKTKPKACNYGLKKATGDYIVIYDAEDAPDPQQLKKTYLAFKQSESRIVCIQSKLNFYNPHQNILTRAFTAEYSTWFDLVLSGLQALGAPIPLGGTSNHFKTSALKELGGWDAFNVTEDADLGMRIARRGYRTALLDSITLEEANSDPKNWFWQRTRWIKGYIQTYFVHTRKVTGESSTEKWKLRDNAIFRLVIGGKIFMMFVNPLMWAITLSYFLFRATLGPTIESFYPRPILYMGSISLLFGNFLYMYYYMIGCAKREHFYLIKYVFLVPVYWLGMSVAAWRALYEVFVKPHHWSKTKHGLHLAKGNSDTDSDQVSADAPLVGATVLGEGNE